MPAEPRCRQALLPRRGQLPARLPKHGEDTVIQLSSLSQVNLERAHFLGFQITLLVLPKLLAWLRAHLLALLFKVSHVSAQDFLKRKPHMHTAQRHRVLTSYYTPAAYQMHTVVHLCLRILAKYLWSLSQPDGALRKTTLQDIGSLTIHTCAWSSYNFLCHHRSGQG